LRELILCFVPPPALFKQKEGKMHVKSGFSGRFLVNFRRFLGKIEWFLG
jgi:hypothetical protein